MAQEIRRDEGAALHMQIKPTCVPEYNDGGKCISRCAAARFGTCSRSKHILMNFSEMKNAFD